MKRQTVTPEEARRSCNADEFTFETTADIEELTRYLGQERALEAVEFGISMKRQGFNLFVVGPEGSGRHSVLQSFINRQAKDEPTPDDWCYVFHFDRPHKPLALQFPPKQVAVFKQEMHELIDALKTTLPTVFEGDEYQSRTRVLNENLKQKVDKIYDELIAEGKKYSIAVIRNEKGIVFAPIDGEDSPMDIDEFQKLPDETKKKIEADIEKLHTVLQQTAHEISLLNREAKEEERRLKQETAGISVAQIIDTLKAKYAQQEKVLCYLNAVEQQLIENVDDFLDQSNNRTEGMISLVAHRPTFDRYDVNVLVSHDESGAPVVYEDLPTYQNLHGRIEHQALV
ncbi:MAG: hypothetical protein D3909_15930, partial [Candidatus Electrothrix sp. ATG1]|nr:hypothetical protein [Candidatus Electrothrix sp. ATG1]